MDAGVRLRPTAEDLESIGPGFTNRWNTFFANAPDKPIMLMSTIAALVTILLDSHPAIEL